MTPAPNDAQPGARTVPQMHKTKVGASTFVLLWVLLLAAATIAVARLPAMRTGDGTEYYALYLAWTQTLRPWMTAASFAAYGGFHDSGIVSGTLDQNYLVNIFPALRVGATADFNHFWFYSLLAAATNALLRPLGLGIQNSFLALHALLFAVLVGIVAWLHGWRGFVAAIVLTLGSPIVWYANKVHTEFLTFCVTLAGIALATRNRMVGGSVFMAIAATQNPGLSFVPVAMLAVRGFEGWKKPFTRWEVVGIVATVVLLALHPAYYFARYGAITPQLVTMGANPGNALGIFYIWFVDPDVGLFPNWPLGLALMLVGTVAWRLSARNRPDFALLDHQAAFWVVWTVFLLASLYSHASTENLNSGGTLGVARYALWYIVLAYPFVLAAIGYFSRTRAPIRFAAAGILLAATTAELVGTVRSVNESYTTPTLLSRFLQSRLPNLYDPPAEIFQERYSGYGEMRGPAVAVVGPDCSKTLLMPAAPADGPIGVPGDCPFTGQQIREWAVSQTPLLHGPAYVRIDAADPSQVRSAPPVEIGRSYGPDGTDGRIAFFGWSQSEGTHRWSLGGGGRIAFTLPPERPARACLRLDGFTFGAQTITARIETQPPFEARLEGEGAFDVPLPATGGRTTVDLGFSDPRSPGATDVRTLAFAVRSLTVRACD